MKLALAYSTKDQVELTDKTFMVLHASALKHGFAIAWCDGSETDAGKSAPAGFDTRAVRVVGGPDAAIAWKLSTLLASTAGYTHIGLVENDVLLDPDWFEPTMDLFEKGKRDGLHVGAVSARSYVDRVLIQRDGYAVMHNCGAGHIIFTREAADIVLRSFRTHWWPANRLLFAQLFGIDLATCAAHLGHEKFVTTDWGWEAQLARHGLATLALTPGKAGMIGQVPPLHEQGLTLTTGPVEERRDDAAFRFYATNLDMIRQGLYRIDSPGIIHSQNGGQLFFPHQIGHLPGASWQGTWELKAVQGFGPFGYRAGAGGASLYARISGSCSYLLSGGADGARASLMDTRSGYRFEPDLPPEQGTFQEIPVPGGPVPRLVQLRLGEGSVCYGIQTADPQVLDVNYRFDWSVLPEAR